jgi:hypothetical protein
MHSNYFCNSCRTYGCFILIATFSGVVVRALFQGGIAAICSLGLAVGIFFFFLHRTMPINSRIKKPSSGVMHARVRISVNPMISQSSISLDPDFGRVVPSSSFVTTVVESVEENGPDDAPNLGL